MILVTGGTGLLGSKLLHKLIENGEKVRSVYRGSSRFGLIKDIKDKVEWIEADVLDVPSLEIAMKGVTKVYHCAAMVSFNPSKREAMYHKISCRVKPLRKEQQQKPFPVSIFPEIKSSSKMFSRIVLILVFYSGLCS